MAQSASVILPLCLIMTFEADLIIYMLDAIKVAFTPNDQFRIRLMAQSANVVLPLYLMMKLKIMI